MSDLQGLDLAAFARLVRHRAPRRPDRRALTATMFAGGRSNLTYAVTDGSRRWVLRRPPLGHVLPTAHDMVREHTVLTRARAHRGSRCPRRTLLCTDPERHRRAVLPDGARRRHAVPHADAARARSAPSAPATLAMAWSTPWPTCTRSTPRRSAWATSAGRRLPRAPGTPLEKQLDGSRSRDLPGAEELPARLAAHVPATATPRRSCTATTGSTTCSSTRTARRQVSAVLDWEMSTLGDPLTDVALLLVYDRLAAGRRRRRRSPTPPPPRATPTRDEMLERATPSAAGATSPTSTGTWPRLLQARGHPRGHPLPLPQGQTVGDGFDTVGAVVEPLLAAGLDATAASLTRTPPADRRDT